MPDNHTIEQLFDGIAPEYDRMNHLMSNTLLSRLYL